MNKTCRYCKGTGIDPKLHYRYTSGVKDEKPCPKCEGQGVIEQTKKQKDNSNE